MIQETRPNEVSQKAKAPSWPPIYELVTGKPLPERHRKQAPPPLTWKEKRKVAAVGEANRELERVMAEHKARKP